MLLRRVGGRAVLKQQAPRVTQEECTWQERKSERPSSHYASSILIDLLSFCCCNDFWPVEHGIQLVAASWDQCATGPQKGWRPNAAQEVQAVVTLERERTKYQLQNNCAEARKGVQKKKAAIH